LWEDDFYENGESIADRIAKLVATIADHDAVAALAIEARSSMNLRHAPLLIMRELARHGWMKAADLAKVIQRADEPAEFLAMYWSKGKTPISNQVKKGLALALNKFDEYSLGKYNGDKEIRNRDVLFLTHMKPRGSAKRKLTKAERKANAKLELNDKEILAKKLAEDTLAIPDTWETEFSAGKDKKLTMLRLMKEDKLGALATLRNLRKMQEVGVPLDDISAHIRAMDVKRVLPFRFIAAARYAPALEPVLEEAMFRNITESGYTLPGKTVVLVDVSGSMDQKLSSKSDMSKLDAAEGLAMILREIANTRVFSFSQETVEVPARRGFALRDAITSSQGHGGTYLAKAIQHLNATVQYDNLIVITDEQSADGGGKPKGNTSFMINVASAKNGVGYGVWNHVDGFSESIVRYIAQVVQSKTADQR
jgi:hypothetical protein